MTPYTLESEHFSVSDDALVWRRFARGRMLLGHADEMPTAEVPRSLRPELAALLSRHRDRQIDGRAEAQTYFFTTRGAR